MSAIRVAFKGWTFVTMQVAKNQSVFRWVGV